MGFIVNHILHYSPLISQNVCKEFPGERKPQEMMCPFANRKEVKSRAAAAGIDLQTVQSWKPNDALDPRNVRRTPEAVLVLLSELHSRYG